MLPDRFYVTGTDTDVGKTVTSALLCAAGGWDYHKPVQAGFPTDADTVAALCPEVRVHPSTHVLDAAKSPHASADDQGLLLPLESLTLPDAPRLLVEGAGGWMVPYRTAPLAWQADLVRRWRLPVLVIARTGLGTLNHTFLTLRALRQDEVEVLGLVLVGPEHPENQRDLARWGAPVLARVPPLTLPDGRDAGIAALREALRSR